MIPGLTPTVYKKGDKVPLFVNKVTSVHSPIPYGYHDLPVCKPAEDQIIHQSETLGEIITGNRIESSSYEINFLEPQNCKTVCAPVTVTGEDLEKMKDLIKNDYYVQWQVDGLPVAGKKQNDEVYDTGFPLGAVVLKQGTEEVYYQLNNHVKISISYNPHVRNIQNPETGEPIASPDSPEYNIVLFEVTPSSGTVDCGGQPLYLTGDKVEVTYTYSVEFKQDAISWANRWHHYLSLQGEGQIHWFSIINSLMIVFFLSGMVAMIMARTVRRDFIKYTEEENETEVDETGWKLVNSDVFRPPGGKGFFAVLVGSGVQVFFMCVVTMVFAVLGFLSPSNQGSIVTAVLVLYVWMGVAAGYSSSRIYLMFEGEHRNRNTFITAIFFPGSVFGIAFFLNFFLWYKHSSGAFPLTTMIAIIALWFCISVPLCFLGSRLAYRKDPPKHPGSVNHIPRQIPAQKWYMHPIATTLMGGILPFGAVFIELFFILTSIWLHRYYFLFGFLFLVFLILVITCAEISVVMCYFQLCAEDWHWWWRSFLTPGASGFYMFLYAIFYYATRLEVDGFVPSLLYFGYSLILCMFFFVLTGTIGFYSCYWFVKKIYAAIHQD